LVLHYGFGEQSGQEFMKKTTTKMRALLAVAAGVVLLQPLASKADVLYQMAWRGHYYARGSNGDVVRFDFSEQDLINVVARNNNLNAANLRFVYRPNKHDTAVVQLNGAFVADVIQMEYTYTDISSTDGTHTVRQAFLYDESHSTSLGSAAGTERLSRDNNGNITSYSFTGSFQYSKPNISTVYTGNFYTMGRIIDYTNRP
jgi:hypothetical protein